MIVIIRRILSIKSLVYGYMTDLANVNILSNYNKNGQKKVGKNDIIICSVNMAAKIATKQWVVYESAMVAL